MLSFVLDFVYNSSTRSSSWSKSFPSALSHMHTMTMKVVSAGKAEASILSKDVVVYTKWKTWNSDPKVFGSPSFVCPGTEPKSSTSIQSATVSSAISNFYFSPSTKKEEKLETNFDADIILDNEEQIIFGVSNSIGICAQETMKSYSLSELTH